MIGNNRLRRLALAAVVVAAVNVAAAQQFAQPPAQPRTPAPPSTPASLPVGRTIAPRSPGDARIREALEKNIDFGSKEISLQEFAEKIVAKFEIGVRLDVVALTADGKGEETILHPPGGPASLKSKLQETFLPHGLAYLVRNDQLVITTKTVEEQERPTRVYQVHDLLLSPHNPTAEPDFDSLIDLIKTTIDPYSWRSAGGYRGDIKPFEGPNVMALVVVQSEDGHDKIERLLAELRAAKEEAVPDRPRGHAAKAPERAATNGPRRLGVHFPPQRTPEHEAFVAANDRFACEIYPLLAASAAATSPSSPTNPSNATNAAKSSGNFVFSPIGLNIAVGSLYSGAAGKTRDEIASAMHYPAAPVVNRRVGLLLEWLNDDGVERTYTLQSRNRFLVDRPAWLKQPHAETLVDDYHSHLISLSADDDRAQAREQLATSFAADPPRLTMPTDGFYDTRGIVDVGSPGTELEFAL